jgi:hypothetical protein
MFSTKGQEVKQGGTPKSLQPGVVYAKIHSSQVRTSSKGDKKILELTLVAKSTDPDFEGWPLDKDNPDGPKYTGPCSRVSATIWTDQFQTDDVNKNDILNKFIVIAKELGLRDEIDLLSTNKAITSIEEWAAAATEILKGHNAYWFLKGSEEEYNDKTITKLSLPKYKFISTDESKLDKFDKTNKYHFKPLSKSNVTSFEPASNDFEM